MKIRTKFSIASGIVVFIIITLLAISTHALVQKTLKKTTQAYIEDSANLLASSISNWMDGKARQIYVLKRAFESDFSKSDFQSGLQNPALQEEFLLMFGTLKEEKGLRSNDPNRVNPPDIDFRERAWYQLGQQSNSVTFTAPYIDAATNELLLSIIAPINTSEGFQGVFGGDLSLDTISRSVNSINFDGNGIAFLVDNSGIIITHPNSDLNSKNMAQVYGALTQSNNTIAEIDYQGKTKLLYLHPLKGDTQVDWSLAVLLDKDSVYASLKTFTKITFVIALFSIAFCLIVLRKLAKHLLNPLESLEKAIKEIASGEGDLTKQLKVIAQDECGSVADNFNKFLSTLRQLITDIITKARSVERGAERTKQLTSESQDSLNEQFQLIDGLATAMYQMSTTSSDISNSAQQAATAITGVNQNADASRTLFEETSDNIKQLSDSISDSQAMSHQLAEYSNSIEQILQVINGIAEQTNLLALNAAIEAARAGEQGRGFAVVADEVRTLASRTQDSTTEIKTMISHIQGASGGVLKSMEESKTKAVHCAEQTEVARSALNDISTSVGDIMDRNIQIAAAIEQQSTVIEDINQSTIKIKDISVNVHADAGEQFTANDELEKEIKQQQDLLGKFVV